MTERYWDVGDPPEALLDWVNENVVAAIKFCWEDDKPIAWMEVVDERVILVVGGPDRPTEEDPLGQRSIYSVTFDLLTELTRYMEDYSCVFGKLSETQREDVIKRATALRNLADQIANLANNVEKLAQPMVNP